MLDFGAIPPEINSARMYSGPGSGPMMAAMAAWDALAAQLELYVVGYSSVIADLGQSWAGGAAMAMAAAAAPYVAWAAATMTLAEQSAAQAGAAAAAYELAFAATVPPSVVTANRTQLAILIATNFFGQNMAAIAATEAAYAEMWAQDAAAMYGYAASSSAASDLTPFKPPPQTTNASGSFTQNAAVAQSEASTTGQAQPVVSQTMSALPQQTQAAASGGSSGNSSTGSSSTGTSSLLSMFKNFNTLTGPANLGGQASRTATSAGSMGTGLRLAGIQAAKGAAKAATGGANALGTGGLRSSASVGVGRAATVGRLSVPPNWAGANPAASITSGPQPLPGNGFRAVPAAEAHPSTNTLGGIPTARTADRAAGVPVLRNGRRAFTMPRPLYGG
ncbi:PPE family protein [Mycobacterium paraseoulense]|uniref:PPE family protein n=2 Tax=Mycobacterium paraseoulense TaxID=590652 RepID=A0A1X0I8D1_9MYCO|nr:PPE family protein [Mycobacterium paraseoulense]ORB39121.1 hypothetical protein BST39_16155 [Mycobacterium paraseoulense]BBZ71453.1 PPE family protein [Mycobacterium paraseoulense]